MDESPKTPDESQPHPLLDRVREEIAGTAWVREGAVRLRESGHLITGDVWVVPRIDEGVVDRVEELTAKLEDLDWRLHGIVVSAVRSLERVPEGLRV